MRLRCLCIKSSCQWTGLPMAHLYAIHHHITISLPALKRGGHIRRWFVSQSHSNLNFIFVSQISPLSLHLSPPLPVFHLIYQYQYPLVLCILFSVGLMRLMCRHTIGRQVCSHFKARLHAANARTQLKILCDMRWNELTCVVWQKKKNSTQICCVCWYIAGPREKLGAPVVLN